MFKVRLLSSIIGILILFGVMIYGKTIFPAVVCMIAFIGIGEFYKSFENKNFKPIKLLGYVSTLLILVLGIHQDGLNQISFFEKFSVGQVISLVVCLIVLLLLVLTVVMNKKYKILDISITFFGIVYVTYFFSFLVLIRNFDSGIHFLWLVFIGAWATDTFAYITGMLIGKRKLIPSVSPKKTIEGSIGGILGSVIISLVYGYFANKGGHLNVDLYHFAIIGFVSGIISQIGDLTASSIKRFVDVKDFGKIMPGHGGILDRFDSILPIAPIVYYYVVFIIK